MGEGGKLFKIIFKKIFYNIFSRQRIEMAERLKREEEERQARRKRVEAIMKRTRKNPENSTNKVSENENEIFVFFR